MGEQVVCGSELAAEKRNCVEGGDLFEEEKKRMKMQEVKMGACFEEVNSGYNLSQEAMSRVTDEIAKKNIDSGNLVRTLKETSPVLIRCDTKVADVNKKAHSRFLPLRNSLLAAMGADKTSLAKQDLRLPNVSNAMVKEFGVSAGKETTYSSNSNPFCRDKQVNHVQCVEMSECASVTGPSAPTDPLALWKKMKQNGFLSSAHSQKVVTIPPVKNRFRKTKADVLKKKIEQARIEQAKKEQVDIFTKIAAPSGLLNELNPGIINHVRNSKQVHSILKALVRPEGHDVRTKGKREIDNSNNIVFGTDIHSENVLDNSSAHGRMPMGHPSVMDKFNNRARENDAGLDCQVATEMGNQSSFKFPNSKNDDSRFPSTKKVPGTASSISTKNNQNNVDSLTLKAATVASQWLELLQHDIKGRLTALRKSKTRVRAVLEIELPHLLFNEFPSNQEYEPLVVKSTTSDPQRLTAEMHETKWNILFSQMDTTLTDEEQQLENWLGQVHEMQLLCDRGLYCEQLSIPAHLQPLQGSDGVVRLKTGNSDMELAVRAAAASIYSTCNFFIEKENIACSQTR